METALENGHGSIADDGSAMRSAADGEDESAPAADFGLPACSEGACSHVLNADAMPEPNALGNHLRTIKRRRRKKHQQAAETARPPSEAVKHLLDKILEFDEDAIVWIIRNLKTRFHPDLYEDADIQTTMSVEDVVQRLDSQEAPAVADHTPPMSPKFNAADTLPMSPKFSAATSNGHTHALDGQPIVQFSSFMYFCIEDDGEMNVEVMRFGDLAERSEVQYRTKDATAIAGKKYVDTSGTLVFEPKEDQKEIHIPILPNDHWETTLEFEIELTTKGLKNAALGFYLHRTCVKIVDDDAFPSNFVDEYRNDILSGDWGKVPEWPLLREYFKMVWRNRDARRDTINMVVVDQLHNIDFLLQLFTNVYLVDYVLNQDKAEDHLVVSKNRDANLILIVALALLPFAFLHAIDYTRLGWELSAAELQRNLLRKFLNYDETSRAELREGNLIMAMNRDANRLVSGGYMQTIALAKAAGKLFMILVYQFASPFAFGTTEYFSEATFWVFSFCPLIVLPLLLMTFMECRRKKNTHVLKARDVAQDELIKHVDQTSEFYRLIADYHRRPSWVERFQKLIEDYDKACLSADQVLKNNEYFQKWVTIMLVAITTLGLGHAVNSPTQYPLGMFLANVAICTYIGDAWAEIYQVLLSMEQVLPALFHITKLMNLQTDLKHRKWLNEYRREKTTQGREALRATRKGTERRLSPNSEELPIDSLTISLKNIQFAYCGRGYDMKFNFVGDMDIKQGSLVALVGHRGEGKTTVLKILGGVILPTGDDEAMSKGQVFYVPSHLRVLHVSSEPMFFHGTLYKNMVFGFSEEAHPDKDIRRVKKICKLLTLPDNVTRFLDTGDELEKELDWDEVFSQTQLALLTLARALITNPEILCVHKPTLFLDVKTSSSVLQVLRYFVEQKGICQDPKSWHLRRPRTCMITISRHEALKVVDCVYLVTKDSIHEIPWKSVTPQLLE